MNYITCLLIVAVVVMSLIGIWLILYLLREYVCEWASWVVAMAMFIVFLAALLWNYMNH